MPHTGYNNLLYIQDRVGSVKKTPTTSITNHTSMPYEIRVSLCASTDHKMSTPAWLTSLYEMGISNRHLNILSLSTSSSCAREWNSPTLRTQAYQQTAPAPRSAFFTQAYYYYGNNEKEAHAQPVICQNARQPNAKTPNHIIPHCSEPVMQMTVM